MKNIADIIKNYTPLNSYQKTIQVFKSAYLAATDYHDGNHYGALTDLTGLTALAQIQRKMKSDSTGLWILEKKPRITNETLDSLASYQEGTLGKSYFNFMKHHGFKPSQRPLVQYVPDAELAYISQRYKEVHDLLHVILLDEVNVHNELIIKWFQMIQLGLPSGKRYIYQAALAVYASPFLSNQMTLSQTAKICRVANKCKFIMNINFEKQFSKSLVAFKRQLSI